VDEVREYIPVPILDLFYNTLPPKIRAEVTRMVQSLSQEYRYLLLERIVKESSHALSNLSFVEETERAMLAMQADKLLPALDFIMGPHPRIKQAEELKVFNVKVEISWYFSIFLFLPDTMLKVCNSLGYNVSVCGFSVCGGFSKW